jgi:hypothetical protein
LVFVRLLLHPQSLSHFCELLGIDGHQVRTQTSFLDVIFLRRAFRGGYPLIDDDRGVLGRDTLNHLTLILDGPKGQWTEYSS